MPRKAEIEVEEEQSARDGAAPAPARAPAVSHVLGLQQSIGNAAVARLLARKEGDGTGSGSRAGIPLDAAIDQRNVDGITSAPAGAYTQLSNKQRIDAIFVLVHDSKLEAEHLDAISSLWFSFGMEMSDHMALYAGLWKECNDKGAKLPRWTLFDMMDLWAHIAPEVITSHQASRVMPAVLKLTDDEFLRYRRVIYFALSGTQRAYIHKALAAGRTIDDIEVFAKAIQIKDDDWLKTNLNVVEEADTGGKGISQQWQMSCGPTTVQVLHAQTDPIYALSLTQSGDLNVTGAGDVSTVGGSQQSKTEQKTILEGHAPAATEIGTAGQGAWVETDMDALKASTGLTYKFTSVTAVEPTNPKDGAVDKAFTAIAGYLDEGKYVPIVIGGSPDQTAHYNMALRHDSTKGLLIHDPGQGASGWCTRQMFLDNKLSPPLAWKLLAGYDIPSKA